MAILSKGTDFSTGDQVTAANLDALVDSATFAAGAVDDTTTALDSSSPQKIIVKNGGIGTTQLADSSSKTTGVTFAKMQHISTAKVLGRSTAGEGDVEEAFDFKDEDNMSSDSATALASQQSIKAYIDSYALKYSGATGTLSTTSSFSDFNLSSIVGTNRAMVIMELFDASSPSSLMFRPKGSTFTTFGNNSHAGYGASGLVVDTTDQGGIIVLVTDSSGIIEVKAGGTITGINYKIHAYQKLL